MTDIQPYEKSKAVTSFTDEEKTLIEQLGYSEIPRNHLAVFFARANGLGLNAQDPSQITIIARNSKNGGKTYTVQVGIQGLRTGARNVCRGTGETYSESEWLYAGDDGQWREIWSVKKDGYPVAAKVTVTRDDAKFSHVVMWEESAQMHNGKPQALWASRPVFMLGKNAAAGAFRKAFPDHMSDVYVDGEFDREPEPVRMTATRKPQQQAQSLQQALEKKPESEVQDDPLVAVTKQIDEAKETDELSAIMAHAGETLDTEAYEAARDLANKRYRELTS